MNAKYFHNIGEKEGKENCITGFAWHCLFLCTEGTISATSFIRFWRKLIQYRATYSRIGPVVYLRLIMLIWGSTSSTFNPTC
jgi:hypothetical protein